MKKAFITKEKALEIDRTFKTPFYIYDEKGIRENARAVMQAFSWNRGFREYFAVKATPNPEILRILHEEGCGTDCSSMTELMMSEAVGIKGSDIMFSSNDTPLEEYIFADKLGAIINLDDFSNIEELKATLGKFPDTVCLRFNPGGYFSISNTIMDNPQDAKYGMTESQIREGFRILKAEGVKHLGIHSFLASSTMTNEYYPELAKRLFKLAADLKREYDIRIEFINLSGGVGIPYRPDQEANDILKIGQGVKRVFDEILTREGLGDIKIFTEMGRFMLAPYGALVTKVIHFKNTHKQYAGVDSCAVNLMRPAMYGAYHHITVLGKESSEKDHVYDVVGSLCENNDKFAIDRPLPELEKGDILFIHDTGAHGFSMGYNYNGKLWSKELLLSEDGTVRMIRRAQTARDYFSTLDIDPDMKKYMDKL